MLKRNLIRPKARWSFILAMLLLLFFTAFRASANEATEDTLCPRMKLYQDFSYASKVPWYQLAAIDQYEHNIASFREGSAVELIYDTIGIRIEPDIWSGPLATSEYETSPIEIGLFGGIGRDGDGDGVADIHNEQDVLYTIVEYIRSYQSFEDAINAYYENENARRIVLGIARLFEKFGTIDLGQRAFPVSQHYNYSFTDGYGAARGWGGRRSHEGIDIFASYGTPVTSTSYGIVEIAGWNEYGGYRVGIRDIYNTYQYYAHLQWFAKEIEVGAIVEPGQMIGSVGSTGYGPEGTSGKFVPHLHYGLYKFDGQREWAFNPYPHLLKWE